MQEKKLSILSSGTEHYLHATIATSDLIPEHKAREDLLTGWMEVLHEQKTKVFYTIILTSLKTAHSYLACTILLIVAIQYVKTSDMSYHLASVLSLNAIFLCVFDILSYLPDVLEEA